MLTFGFYKVSKEAGLLFSYKIVSHRTKTSLQRNSSTRGSPYKREKSVSSLCLCVCVCVCERERERECVCVCVCVCDRKQERETESVCVCVLTLQPPQLQSARLLCPWDFPVKNTGMGCHFLLQGIFLTQESNPHLLHCRQILYR